MLHTRLLEGPWKLDPTSAEWIVDTGIGYLIPETERSTETGSDEKSAAATEARGVRNTPPAQGSRQAMKDPDAHDR